MKPVYCRTLCRRHTKSIKIYSLLHEESRADRQAVQRCPPVPVRFEFCFVPSFAYGGFERRGVAESLIYSSTPIVPKPLRQPNKQLTLKGIFAKILLIEC